MEKQVAKKREDMKNLRETIKSATAQFNKLKQELDDKPSN
jgi:cell division protein FtsB